MDRMGQLFGQQQVSRDFSVDRDCKRSALATRAARLALR
jgi:hypothetical protein